GGELAALSTGAHLTLDRPLLSATGTAFNTGLSPGSSFIAVQGGGGATLSDSSTSPFVTLNGGSLTTQTGSGTAEENFFHAGSQAVATVNLAGPFLNLQNLPSGSANIGSGSLFRHSGGARVTVAGPVLDLTTTNASFICPGVR